MCLALGVHDRPFGGKSVVFAGDFGQLPPPGHGAAALYSGGVGTTLRADTLRGQTAALGKALWHQVTTVVLLRQNMRQKGMSDEDKAFRVALENARLAACTNSDIKLLRTRVVSPRVGRPHLTDPLFRNISVITSLNAQRDMINVMGCARFAKESNQTLHTFYSVDTWPNSTHRTAKKKTAHHKRDAIDPVRTTNIISPNLQEILWRLNPAATKHLPGKLELCLGMPVLLKHNEATELCATNGAEGIVRGWERGITPTGKPMLRTVFVELLKPPREVQIAGLPPNVIPVPSSKHRIECLLPNDETISIDREQPAILPNFAMTDFCGQGRTRPRNPVDLFHSKSHQAIYTALSRSSSLQGTMIMREFEPRKLCNGMTAHL
ncbi:hypothetical protein OBBRIDRAFT_697309, partial [Obba rivulosa]